MVPVSDQDGVDLGAGWELDDDHPFIGMSVEVETTDDETVAGTIVAIWIYQGEPRRMDVERDEAPLFNADRERVGVSG